MSSISQLAQLGQGVNEAENGANPDPTGMNSAFSAIYQLGLQHGQAASTANPLATAAPKVASTAPGMNKTMASDTTSGTVAGQSNAAIDPTTTGSTSTTSTTTPTATAGGTSTQTPSDGQYTYDSPGAPVNLPPPTVATAAQMADAQADPWVAAPTTVTPGSVNQQQASQASTQATYDQSIINDINSGMSAGALQAKYGPRFGTIMANMGSSGAKWTDNAGMLTALTGYLQGDETNAQNVAQDYADQQANATVAAGVQQAMNTHAAQDAATTANQQTFNNAAASAAAAGGAMAGHAAGVNAAATTGVTAANTALGKATDQVNGANNALSYTENQLQTEMANHTISANAAINQMNDTLASISQQLANTQGQDALNLRTQSDSITAQLQQLQNDYAQKKIDDTTFWSEFGTIMSTVGKVASVAVAAA